MNLVDFLVQNASAIITVLGFAGSAIGGAYLLRNDVRMLKTELIGVKDELKDVKKDVTGLTGMMITLARYDERMNAMDKRTDERFANIRRDIDLLRRGEGFVLPIHRGAHEYGDDGK